MLKQKQATSQSKDASTSDDNTAGNGGACLPFQKYVFMLFRKSNFLTSHGGQSESRNLSHGLVPVWV